MSLINRQKNPSQQHHMMVMALNQSGLEDVQSMAEGDLSSLLLAPHSPSQEMGQ